MDTLPKVTILMPTYSRAHFLPEALESALAQTHANLEILIFDDASPDETPKVARAFAERDERVRYIRHPQNLGITGNWRAAISAATGEYVCFLEDDDRFQPEFVERMLSPLQADAGLALTFCDHWIIDVNGKRDLPGTEVATRRFRRGSLPSGPVEDLIRAAILDASIGITAAMFRREYLSVDFIDDRAHGGIDLWLLYQCARANGHGYYLPERLMEYRVHGGGMSHSMPELMGLGHVFLYETALQDDRAEHLRSALRKRLADILASRGIYLLTTGETAEARRLLAQSLRNAPTLRAAVAGALTLINAPGAAIAVRRGKRRLRR